MAYNNYGGGNDRYGGGGDRYGGGGNDRYGDSGRGGGQGGGYGGSNRYEQQGNPYGSSQQQRQARYDQPSQNNNANPYGRQTQQPPVEMQSIQDPYANGNGNAPSQGNPHAILNECREIQRAIDDLEGDLQTLQRAQRGFVSGSGATNREIDAMGADIMGTYRSLGERVKKIKSRPEAGNPQNAPQVGNLDRRIKKAINMFQQQESAFRKEVQEQQKRQYLIVNPNATESEIREVTEAGSGDQQIFQQALLNSNRRGQAQSTLANVRQRHDAIQNIERTMIELAELFQDLDQMVVQQDVIVQNVEKHAEDTQQHIVEANVQLTEATKKARSARKKKWICLGICVAIVIIVAAVIVIYGATQGWFKKTAAPATTTARLARRTPADPKGWELFNLLKDEGGYEYIKPVSPLNEETLLEPHRLLLRGARALALAG